MRGRCIGLICQGRGNVIDGLTRRWNEMTEEDDSYIVKIKVLKRELVNRK